MLTNDDNEFLTVREVAHYCRLHEMTVRRHIKEGRLRAVRIGRSVRIPREELSAYGAPSAPASIDEAPLTGLMVMKRWPKTPRSKRQPPDPRRTLLDVLVSLAGTVDSADAAGIARNKYSAVDALNDRE